MKNRISRCAALIGTVLSLSSFAQVCQEVSLYKNGEAGKIDAAETRFPEAPEWSANWGEMEALTPPYIRLSGQKDRAGDWTGTLSLAHLPVTVQNGNLMLNVRSTQNARFGVWLVGDFGNSTVKYFDLGANRTKSIKVPVADLVGNRKTTVTKIGVGLFNVPAYQYTTLFIDDISIGCVSATGETLPEDFFEYPFEIIDPSKPSRQGKFTPATTTETTMAYTEEARQKTKDSTQMDFVISAEEFEQITNFANADSMTAQKSRDGWFRNMFFIDRNRLRDSVIANPKALFYEAATFAAANGNQSMPLLLGNIDYAYRGYVDSTLQKTSLFNSRILQAGLPSAWIKGSHLKIFYDPYFICTNRKSIPKVEIYTNGKWVSLEANSSMDIEFDSAGKQIIKVRLSEGGLTVNQNLYVEVK